jgi:HSP20 family molecular chaperone IbpA
MIRYPDQESSPSRSAFRLLSPWEWIGSGIEQMLRPAPTATIRGSRPWIPEIQVILRPREIVLRVVSPELDPRRIRIQRSGRTLTLSAADRDGPSGQHAYRAFRRSIVLPDAVDGRHFWTRVRGHVLTVRVGKSEAATNSGVFRRSDP